MCRLVRLLSPAALLTLSACSPFVIGAQPDIVPGGRAVSIAVMPGSDPYLLVASETGGLFRSRDAGVRWTHVDALPSWLVRDVAYSPVNGNIVIATTDDYYLDAPNGGIWRSTDGGQTWSRAPGAVPPAGPGCTARPSAHGISFDRNTGRIVVGTDCGISIGSSDGATWLHLVMDQFAPGGQFRHRVWSVLALPGNRIYAAGDRGIAVSPDGGGMWLIAPGPPARAQAGALHALAASPFSVDHVFVVAPDGNEGNVLFFSNDGGRRFTRVRSGDTSSARAAFVRTARAAGSNSLFDVYFGDGVRLWRQWHAHGDPPSPTDSWQEVRTNHADPSDIAFGLDGATPILIATDGGVHRLASDGIWKMAGGGRDGYNALQITDATGQPVSGTSPHVDLYFATQDNSIWASPDGGSTWPRNIGGEGFHLRTPRRADAHAARVVTGSRCAPCRSFVADSDLANAVQWPNPTTEQGVPFLLRRGAYVQVVRDPTPHLMLTTDTGATWTARGALPERIRGPLVVGGAGTPTPVVYSAVVRDGTMPDGSPKLGLVRIDNIFGPGDVVVTDADGGLEGAATFPTMFAQYRVLGVNSANPDHLITPDVATGEMKSSTDGGRTWAPEPELTSLVTDAGRFRFNKGNHSLVSAIAWDPDNECHVLIGTRQNGIFRSTDGGRIWAKFPDSDQVTNLSSFFFESSGTVLVSSYGRGLWRMLVSTVPTMCTRQVRVAPPPKRLLEIWEMTQARRPFEEPGKPPVCPECTYVLVHWGEVTDIVLSGATLQRLGVSGGMVRHVNQRGGVAPLPPIDVKPLPPTDKAPGVLAQIRREKLAVRGLVLERGELRGVLAGRADLKNPDLPPPRLTLSSTGPTGDPMVFAKERLTVTGTGFQSTSRGGARLLLSIDGRVRVEDLVADERGQFRHELPLSEISGEHVIEVIQVNTETVRVAREVFSVVPQEGDVGK